MIHFNIILTSTPKSFSRSLSFRFLYKKSVWLFIFLHACHMPHQSPNFLFDYGRLLKNTLLWIFFKTHPWRILWAFCNFSALNRWCTSRTASFRAWRLHRCQTHAHYFAVGLSPHLAAVPAATRVAGVSFFVLSADWCLSNEGRVSYETESVKYAKRWKNNRLHKALKY
jgi:hypothetical protein